MKRFISSILCLLFLAVLAGCGSEEVATENNPLVKTKTISLRTGASEGNYPGAVKGRYETTMSFQVGGRILQRYVQAGDYVHAGDVLMTIDSRDVVQQAVQGEAQVAAAKAQLELARSNLNRYSALYEQEAISAEIINPENAADKEIPKNEDSENTADFDFDENEEFVDDDFLEM